MPGAHRLIVVTVGDALHNRNLRSFSFFPNQQLFPDIREW